MTRVAELDSWPLFPSIEIYSKMLTELKHYETEDRLSNL
ncbi:hypothetical protein P186_2764 [Pyrobaculum ferrireducens]|uniref:Uncharacterized protein n=1 Tax=Pyrobaculum ferrireducens TaxID=1104324 RepID=G7VEX6_9CREN|nr:hypothetical protein P186_2764 [Pyrobaculum ferrireducens]